MDKLRILALHGYHGSADILRSQLRALAEELSPLADFVYVDAPSLTTGDFGWWHAVGKEGSMRYEGWSRTRDWLKQLCATKGPFDGVFGFSQGAALTALLVGLCAAEATHSAPELHFDFAMMAGGFASSDARHAPLYEALRGKELPTLHIIGRSDSVVSSTQSHTLARRFESPLILEHDGGHVIAATPQIRREARAFLERMVEQAQSRRKGRAGQTATTVAQAARQPSCSSLWRSTSPSQSSPPSQSPPLLAQSSSPEQTLPSQRATSRSQSAPASYSHSLASSSSSSSSSQAHAAAPLDVPLWRGRAHSALRIHWPARARAAPLPALLVFRGGAYATDRGSGEGTAEWAAQHGVIGVEVEYATRATGQSYPAGYADAARAVRLVRAHAAEWNIDPTRIGVIGYSAGGHLASLLSTQPSLPGDGTDDLAAHISARPDLVVLAYPLISFVDHYRRGAFVGSVENFFGRNDISDDERRQFSNELHVTAAHPPVFIWTTKDDALVPYTHSQRFVDACKRANVPVTYELYAHGQHGMGLALDQRGDVAGWTTKLAEWLKQQWNPNP